MLRRPLAFALALALLPAAAQADDLLQSYTHARNSDPQYAAAESRQLATREGAVQARAAMLPQINGTATLRRSKNEGPATFQSDPTQPPVTGDISSTTTSRSLGLDGNQMLYDRSRFSTLKGQQALTRASEFQLQSDGVSLITRTSAAYFNVLVQLETLSAAEAAEAALKKQFDFASKRLEVGLEVGTRTVLDVLNNQRTLFSAQQDYAQAKYNFLQNRLLLEQAAGTLQLADLEDVNRLLTTDESVAKAIGTQ